MEVQIETKLFPYGLPEVKITISKRELAALVENELLRLTKTYELVGEVKEGGFLAYGPERKPCIQQVVEIIVK